MLGYIIENISGKYGDIVARLRHNWNTRSLTRYSFEQDFGYLTVVFNGLKLNKLFTSGVLMCGYHTQQKDISDYIFLWRSMAYCLGSGLGLLSEFCITKYIIVNYMAQVKRSPPPCKLRLALAPARCIIVSLYRLLLVAYLAVYSLMGVFLALEKRQPLWMHLNTLLFASFFSRMIAFAHGIYKRLSPAEY